MSLGQKDVAQRAAISPRDLWRYEVGLHLPSITTLEKLARAFTALGGREVSVSDLMALGLKKPHPATVRARISKRKSLRGARKN